jgi:pilus assembly protein Flp/PilA
MLKMISRLVRDEEGQGLAEYALILVLIAVAVIGALELLGGGIDGILKNIAGTLGNPAEE